MPGREIKRTAQFKRDFKAIRHDMELVADLSTVIADLSADIPLHGEWEGSRDCHIRPDVVLIYEKIDREIRILSLQRVGSHSKLF